MNIQIWMEGYAATGEHGTAQMIWEGEAENFDDAVRKYLQTQSKEFEQTYYTYSVVPVRGSKHAIWACRLFDNEAEARKSFG